MKTVLTASELLDAVHSRCVQRGLTGQSLVAEVVAELDCITTNSSPEIGRLCRAAQAQWCHEVETFVSSYGGRLN